MKYPACPTTLTPTQLDQFQRDGFLAFTNVLNPSEVATARATLSELIQRSVRNADFAFDASGRITQSKASRFLVQFEPTQPGIAIHTASAGELELCVRKLMWFCDVSPFFETLAMNHPRLRGVVESLLGANPIRFQDMALVKPPFIGTEKPWHQDNAYFAVTPLEAVLGVWIALDDALVENGCMHVLVGEHKVGPRKHYHGTDCEIMPDRLHPERAVPVELPAGGAMFFAGMLPHQTPPNSSPRRRRALQFHYRSATSRIVTKDEYDKVYAEADGTPASCAAIVPPPS